MFTLSCPYDWGHIIASFPAVTRETPVPGVFLHDVVHQLNITGPPLFSHPRRLPPDRAQAARFEFDYMLKNGICPASSSPRASSLLLVTKKYGTFRPCGDYRRLNAVTSVDRYSLPHLHDFTAHLSGVPLFQNSTWSEPTIRYPQLIKTSRKLPSLRFKNAAQTFQRVVNNLLRGLNFSFILRS